MKYVPKMTFKKKIVFTVLQKLKKYFEFQEDNLCNSTRKIQNTITKAL